MAFNFLTRSNTNKRKGKNKPFFALVAYNRSFKTPRLDKNILARLDRLPQQQNKLIKNLVNNNGAFNQ